MAEPRIDLYVKDARAMRRYAIEVVRQMDFFLSRPYVYGEHYRTFCFSGNNARRLVATSERCERRHHREEKAGLADGDLD